MRITLLEKTNVNFLKDEFKMVEFFSFSKGEENDRALRGRGFPGFRQTVYGVGESRREICFTV